MRPVVSDILVAVFSNHSLFNKMKLFVNANAITRYVITFNPAY